MPKEELAIEPNRMNRTLLGFLVAPLIPVFIFSLMAGAYFFIILMIGVPAAYVGALVIGAPLLFVLRKLNCLSWHYFLMGGVLCALPFGWFYSGSASTHLEIYGLRNMVMFCAIGAAGGLTFWFLSVRTSAPVSKSLWREVVGIIGFLLVTISCVYVYYFGTSSSYEGKMLEQNLEFISSSSREVKIELSDGAFVDASLPKNLPYRPRCSIYVTSRRSYINRESLYWVNGYKDAPFVHIWAMLSQSKKNEIPRSCG
ncbi:hypothetical protein [Microbulbifer agarilyticus]|uniref:hypothetical protein n=1 Tax=Microbulbifer agarilyticus TaxID=260552 RepID=UPI001CD60B27|nr:hypothetical protein [Microbulbifer agarilyticus]MCA0895142.1 hypothetical protein [Microbulbifer agarilyticus]